jgi:Uncharacterized protein conserved in bacteria (DUF2252)
VLVWGASGIRSRWTIRPDERGPWLRGALVCVLALCCLLGDAEHRPDLGPRSMCPSGGPDRPSGWALFGEDEAIRFAEQVGELLESYTSTLSPERRRLVERFHFADIARKVVGVGSVGTRAWVVLMLGRDNGDPLLLQFKEAQPSVLERYLGASVYDHHGRRVVEGQRLMQAATDVLLGWQRTTGPDGVQRDFYVRELWDRKGSAAVELMTPRAMRLYASACGWTLARAHARSGTLSPSPPTSARARHSIARWLTSPSSMPTRTSVTTPRSRPPSPPVSSTPPPVFEGPDAYGGPGVAFVHVG